MLKMITSAVKTMAAAIVLLVAVTNTVSAQDRAEAGAKRLTDRMKTELSLNDDQYSKVQEINKDFIGKTMETKNANADQAAKADRAKAVKELNEQREAKLKTVLTEEQFKTYLANKAKKTQRFQERRMERSQMKGSKRCDKKIIILSPA